MGASNVVSRATPWARRYRGGAAPVAVAAAHGAKHAQPVLLAKLQHADQDDEADAAIAVLGIGEGQQAEFTELVAAIACEAMPEVVLIAEPVAEALTIRNQRALFIEVTRFHETLGAEVLPLHESQIAPAEAAGRELAQVVPIGEGAEQVRLGSENAPALGQRAEAAETLLEGRA